MEFDIMPFLSELMMSLPGGELLFTFLVFILVLSVLVFVHEFGHYFAARSVGVGVEIFSIGFGRELWGWDDKHGTRWKISLVPLGGYVKMHGDENLDDVLTEERHKAFLHKQVWERMWVVVAGPLANFLFAIVAMAALMWSGEQQPVPMDEQSATVGQVFPGSPADNAGLEMGDVIVSLAGQDITRWMQVVESVRERAGQETAVTVRRDGQLYDFTMTPVAYEETVDGETRTVGKMGIGYLQDTTLTRHGLGESIVLGFTKTWDYTALIITSIKKMITKEIPADQVGGPILIAEMAGKTAQMGSYHLVMFMIIISINLGIINLLPIPMLDGGHLAYYIVEAAKGSPVSEKAQEVGYKIGMTFIMLLFVFVFYNDISRVVERNIAVSQFSEDEAPK